MKLKEWVDEQNQNLSRTSLGFYFCPIVLDDDVAVYLNSTDIAIQLFRVGVKDELEAKELDSLALNKIKKIQLELSALVD